MGQESVPVIAKVVAVGAAAEAGVKVIQAPDPMLFGLLPEPLFFAAMLGASIGVFLMQKGVATKLGAPTGATTTGRILGTALKMLTLAASVIGFACLATGLVAAVLDYLTDGPTVTSTPGWVGATIVLGAFIHPLLPKLQGAWERAIDATVSAYERVIGGGP